MIEVIVFKPDDVIRYGGAKMLIMSERVNVRLGSRDDSDYIDIERDEETGEYRVLLQSPGNEAECLFSCIEEGL